MAVRRQPGSSLRLLHGRDLYDILFYSFSLNVSFHPLFLHHYYNDDDYYYYYPGVTFRRPAVGLAVFLTSS